MCEIWVEPYVDIDITFTGLRPGEKLFEELLISGEGIRKTIYDKIMVLAPVVIDRQELQTKLDALFGAARIHDISGMIALLRLIVPEYIASATISDAVPISFQQMRPDLFPGESHTESSLPSAPLIPSQTTTPQLVPA
jgi:FlaA1/EpsC-like NDP-sugar epimerase